MISPSPLEPIEGFFIETYERLIFDVKGITHPSRRIIAFVRYVPKGNIKDVQLSREDYTKFYNLKDRFTYLENYHQKYIFNDPNGRGLLQAVALDDILRIYNPQIRLKELVEKKSHDYLEKYAVELAKNIVEVSSIPWSTLGISGSLLINLHNESSDVDLVVYGKDNGLKVYAAMKKIFAKSKIIKKYTSEELKLLWIDRGQEKQIPFDIFRCLEANKMLQGKIHEKDFYIRLILYPNEFYEPWNLTTITPLGEAQIEAVISDDSGGIFTPCTYQIKKVKILSGQKCENLKRLFSLRGRYCEIAQKGDKISARGKLEVVCVGEKVFQQLTLGTTENEFFKKIS